MNRPTLAPASIALLALVLATSFAAPTTARGQTPPELFQKAKQQMKLDAWEDARKTLERLDAESLKPGNEGERKKLESSLIFYRGVCEAALGRDEDARADFTKFLVFVPNATIDPAAFPKKAVAVFEQAKKSAAPVSASTSSRASSEATLPAAYAKFRPDPAPPAAAGEGWAKGPVRFLLTAEDKNRWESLSDDVARAEFVTAFWASRDATPDTPKNECREEFERRVAFADQTLGQQEQRGSLTDRGMVFVLLGPPTFIGRRSLGADSDGSDVRQSSPGKVLDTQANFLESWHYRRDLLPPGTPFLQVDFDFVTRRGYGSNVLQRDSKGLATLEAAKRARTGG